MMTTEPLTNTELAEKRVQELTAALDYWRKRAEVTEAKLAKTTDDLTAARNYWRERAMSAEAKLAAQQWRPVTEKPENPGWYLVYDSDGHVFYNADIFPYRVARWTGKWDSAFNGLVDYWRPLPPAPQEPTP